MEATRASIAPDEADGVPLECNRSFTDEETFRMLHGGWERKWE